MRYATDHKANTRARLIDRAGALAKQRGFAATGVDALVASAGLTAGAFYAHFGSKTELLGALVEAEMGRSLDRFDLDSPQSLAAGIASYLSHGHVEHPERGCILPALTAEIARSDDATRAQFERHLVELEQRLAASAGGDAGAWSLLAQVVGGVLLARAVRTRETRQQILAGVRHAAIGALQSPPGTADEPAI